MRLTYLCLGEYHAVRGHLPTIYENIEIPTIDEKGSSLSLPDPVKKTNMSNKDNMINFAFSCLSIIRRNTKLQVGLVRIGQESKPDMPQGLVHETLILSVLLFTFALKLPDRRAENFHCFNLLRFFGNSLARLFVCFF